MVRVLATLGLLTCIMSITAGVVYVVDKWFDDVPDEEADN